MPSSSSKSATDYTALNRKILSAALRTIVALAVLLMLLMMGGEYLFFSHDIPSHLAAEAAGQSFTIDTIVEHRTRRAAVAASTDQVLSLARLMDVQAAALSSDRVDTSLKFLKKQGFSALSIVRKDGVVINYGQRVRRDPRYTLPFANEVPSELIWQDGYFLRTTHDIIDAEGNSYGKLIAEQRADGVQNFFDRQHRPDTTANVLLCGKGSDGFTCFQAQGETTPLVNFDSGDGRSNRIEQAINGGAGSSFGVLSGQKSLAIAAAPVGHTGLALARTIATREALTPMYVQIGVAAILILALLTLGNVMLNSQVKPLADRLYNAVDSARKNEERFTAAVQSSLNGFYILESVRDSNNKITDFRFVYLNRHGEDLIGRSSKEILGRLLCEEIPVNRTGGFFAKYCNVVETGVPYSEEVPVISKDVRASWLQYQVVRLGDGVAVTTSDMTRYKQVEVSLARSLSFSQAIIDASAFSIIVTDLEGTIVAVNPAAERMLWYTRAEMVGRMTPLSIHDAGELHLRSEQLSDELGIDVPPTLAVFMERPNRGLVDDGRWTYIRKDGSRLQVQLSVTALRDENGRPTGYMGTAYDLTERLRQEDYISHISHHDSLTGLPTRTLLADRVERALGRARSQGTRCALILIDLDNFKSLNDLLGHHVGDEILAIIGGRIKSVLEDTDTLARMGGDEFAVLLDTIASEVEATNVARRLLYAIAQPVTILQDHFSVSASIGLSMYPEAGSSFTLLLKHADTAMYHAKHSGKNDVCVFSQGLADASTRQSFIEQSLYKAVETAAFTLVYQPQVSLEDGRILGVEALIRWTDERLGAISPAEFIPIAEASGTILPIGEWLLRTACSEIAALTESTGIRLRLAVNLSPRQFEQKNFVGSVARTLAAARFPPRDLEMEITEGVLMNDSPAVWESIRSLQALGLQTTIDDFGVGFSNVSYLLKLAVNRLKIDRSFIAGIEDDPGCNAVVSSIISMARDLNVTVLAEGVERNEQCQILANKGCQEAQGFLFYRPMPLDQLASVLSAIGRHDARPI